MCNKIFVIADERSSFYFLGSREYFLNREEMRISVRSLSAMRLEIEKLCIIGEIGGKNGENSGITN